MSTPEQIFSNPPMPTRMPVYRALVTYASSATGEIRIKVPSLLGADSEVFVSKIGRQAHNGEWSVPSIGSQIVITADDHQLTNIFWLQTDNYGDPLDADPTYSSLVGFENAQDSVFSFDNTTRTLTLSPVSTSYTVWVAGHRYTFTTPQSISIANTTGGYFIAFDINGQLQTSPTFQDLQTHAPVSFIYWDSTVGGASGPTFIADERHGIVMDWATHEYLHRTRGSAYASGFDASDYSTTGNGSSADHVKISITNGTFYDEDYQIDIVHSTTPASFTWQQRLQSGAYLPVYYLNGTTWKKTIATQKPLMYGSVRPYYNSIVGASGSLVEMSNNRYGIIWVVASNGLNEPVFALMGQTDYANIGDAEIATWSQVLLPSLPVYEFRPLYKIIFQALNTGVYAAFREVMDIRKSADTAAGTGVTSLSLDNLNDVIITTPTTNQGLLYNGTNWINSTDIVTSTGFTDYTPTLTASTTNPTNYTATGRYVRIQNVVYYYFNISFNTGASAGSGTYRISLPINAAQPTPKLGQSGSVQLYDSSVAFGLFNVGVPIAANSTYLQMIYHGSSVGGVTNSTPWTWAVDDIIRGFIIYEAA